MVIFAVGLIACEDSAPTPTPPRDATMDGAGDVPGKDVSGFDAMQGDVPGADAMAPGDAAADGAGAALSDGEIFATLAAADQGEIAQGQLAQTQATNAQVRTFGGAMVSMHMMSSARLTALASSLGVAPVENALSRMLTADATATRQRLAMLSGAAFDAAYMDAQVTQHARVLEIVDTALLPNAMNAQLRTELMTAVRPMVAMHLQQARDLRAMLP